MITIIEPIELQPILDQYEQLADSIQWTDMGHKGKQVGLQYKEGQDPWSSAVGKSQGNDLGCTLLNPFFKDTIFEDIINKYNLKRTRLMWVGPFACYSIHQDESPRIHVPMITNPDCMFLFKYGVPAHLEKGFVHWVDTRKYHTFINCSDQNRLHLVGAVES